MLRFLKRNKIIIKELSDFNKNLTDYELSCLNKISIEDISCPNCDSKSLVIVDGTFMTSREYHCKQCGIMYAINKQQLIPNFHKNNLITSINYGFKNRHLDLSLNRMWKITKVQKELLNLLKNKNDG